MKQTAAGSKKTRLPRLASPFLGWITPPLGALGPGRTLRHLLLVQLRGQLQTEPVPCQRLSPARDFKESERPVLISDSPEHHLSVSWVVRKGEGEGASGGPHYHLRGATFACCSAIVPSQFGLALVCALLLATKDSGSSLASAALPMGGTLPDSGSAR